MLRERWDYFYSHGALFSHFHNPVSWKSVILGEKIFRSFLLGET